MSDKTDKSSALSAVDPDRFNSIYWEPDFWLGYRRGLNRRLYGKIFGNDEEHRSWYEIPDNLEEEPCVERIARGVGYRIGYAGISLEQAAGKIKEFMDNLKEKYKLKKM